MCKEDIFSMFGINESVLMLSNDKVYTLIKKGEVIPFGRITVEGKHARLYVAAPGEVLEHVGTTLLIK